MSAEAQGSPCPNCHALGWVPLYSNSGSSIEICHECEGEKYIRSQAPDRALLGLCLYCKQEISINGAPPCLPEYPSHVILSDLTQIPLEGEK